jgi:pyruvate kinase
MRKICAEAESNLTSRPWPRSDEPASLTGFVEPMTEAAVDAACLFAHRLGASLIVVATGSGRAALALSNRRPSATVLALTRTEQVARSLAVCWGVTPIIQPEVWTAERELFYAIDWAKSRGLVRPGENAVMVRGQVPGEDPSRAVLAREVR